MNSITITPSSSPFNLTLFHPENYVSFSIFRATPPKTPLCVSCSSHNRNLPTIPSKNHVNRSLPINVFSRFNPILQILKNLTAKHKWSSYLQDPSVQSHHFSSSDAETTPVLLNGGLGMALLTMKSTARDCFSPIIAALATNPTFVSGLFACFLAQWLKVVLNFFVERKWDFKFMCASGGMPSSHSALCTALTTSVAICHGITDSLFPVCLGFSLIVMYDAIGVRRHAGMQAQVLNKIIEDLFHVHPISERKLKELLGHTPSQVFAGALLGIVVAYFCCQGVLSI